MFIVYNEQDIVNFGRPGLHRHRGTSDFVFSF